MKLRKSASWITTTLFTFLMSVVMTTRTVSRSSIPQQRQNRYVLWDTTSPFPERDLPSRVSSRGNSNTRIRRSDYTNGNGQAELIGGGGGARYLINASPTSQPIMFFADSSSESHEVKNSMLLIKKKKKKPQQITVFTHGSVTSEQEPPKSESQQSGSTMNVHTHHKPGKLKTTLSPPMHYQDFNSRPSVEKYHVAENTSPHKNKYDVPGSVWRRTTKTPSLINNHHPGSYLKPRPTLSPPEPTKQETKDSAVVWKLPTTNMPPSGVISNHSPGTKEQPLWKKPSSNNGHHSNRPYDRIKNPAYFGQTSSTTTKRVQLTTAIPHHYPDPPMSASQFLKNQVIPSYLTSTTKRGFPDSFSTASYQTGSSTERPPFIEIKPPPLNTPSATMQHIKKPVFQDEAEEDFSQVNNHGPSNKGTALRRKPLVNPQIHFPSGPLVNPQTHFPSGQVAIVDKHTEKAVHVIGERIKLPETVRSKWMTILDAPPDRATTIKHNKIVVVQKRTDHLPQATVSPPVHNQFSTTVVVTSQPILTLTTKKNTKTATTKPTTSTKKPTKAPHKDTYPVAPVMDPWDNVPIPAPPSWAVASTTKAPNFASPSGSSFFPGMPFMPFLSSIITPLLSRPLTPSALSTGMQGIKAMQGFLRNSLVGAMFCFLPSAVIAMTMNARQRAELRKIPEMNDFMMFCKECLENLGKTEKSEREDEPHWVENL